MVQHRCPQPENISGNAAAEDTSSNLAGARVLTDDELTAGGLRKISAFVHAERSPNAERVKRARKKLTDSGVAQVNVLAPAEAHNTIKAVAKALQTTKSVQRVFEDLLTSEVRATNPDSIIIITTKRDSAALQGLAHRLSHLSGFRRFIARLIGLI